LTLPRLELQGAVLGIKLKRLIVKEFDLNDNFLDRFHNRSPVCEK